MPDFTEIPLPSVSEELLAFASYDSETQNVLINTLGFNKLIIFLQKTDVSNGAIVASGDPGDWSNTGNAVDGNFDTNTNVNQFPSPDELIIDFGSSATRVCGVDWACDWVGQGQTGSYILATSDSEGSGYTNRISHSDNVVTRVKEFTISHSFRYARVTMSSISVTTANAQVYQIYDAGLIGGDANITLQYKNEQNNDWFPLEIIDNNYVGVDDDIHIIGDNNITALTNTNTTYHGGGTIIPQTPDLLRVNLVFTGALKMGLQVVKVA